MEYPRYLGDTETDHMGMADYAPVIWVEPPEYNSDTQLCIFGPPEFTNNNWYTTWIVRNYTQIELDQITEFNERVKEKLRPKINYLA
jgi:hypothetical protein